MPTLQNRGGSLRDESIVNSDLSAHVQRQRVGMPCLYFGEGLLPGVSCSVLNFLLKVL